MASGSKRTRGLAETAGAVRIVLLGRFRVLIQGKELPGTAAQPLRSAVLARIALGTDISRDLLLTTFWPERSEGRARHALSQVLHKLRRDLGAQFVVSDGDRLRLEARVAVDAREFEAAVQRHEPERALDLYQGSLLEGLRVRGAAEFDRWLELERRRLGALHARACHTRARELETAGDTAAAVDVLQRWCAAEPFDDTPQFELIELLLRCGRWAAARQAERDFLERLHSEDLEPGPEFAYRLRSAFQAVATAATLPLGTEDDRSAAGAGPVRPGESSRERVLLVPFENLTGDPDLDALGRLAADWIAEGMDRAGLGAVVPLVEALRLVEASGQEDRAIDPLSFVGSVGRAAHAGTLVAGSFARVPGGLELRARVVDVTSGELVGVVEPVTTPPDADEAGGLGTLRDRLLGLLAAVLDTDVAQLPSTPALGIAAPTYQAYRVYSAGLERFLGNDYAGAIPLLQHAVVLDPACTRASLLTAAAYMKLGQWEKVEEVVAALHATADRLSPYEANALRYYDPLLRGDRIGLYELGRHYWPRYAGSIVQFVAAADALAVNRPAEAARVLAQMDPSSGWLRTFRDYWHVRAAAHHVLGEHEIELELARQARAAFPGSLDVLVLEARALAALGKQVDLEECLEIGSGLPPQGEWSGARVALAAATELRAHGFRAAGLRLAARVAATLEADVTPGSFGASLRGDLAHALCLAESWQQAEPILSSLVEEFPENLEYHGRIGCIAARRGDRATAELGDHVLQQMNRPYLFGRETAWRARIAALLGDLDRALRLLVRAFAEGQPYGVGLHADADLEPLRQHEGFRRLLRPKG